MQVSYDVTNLYPSIPIDKAIDVILQQLSEDYEDLNPLRTNPTKWPNTLKQFVGKLPTNCLSVFGHFVNLALKGLKQDRNYR